MTRIIIIATRPDELEIVIRNPSKITLKNELAESLELVKANVGQKILVSATQKNLEILNDLCKCNITLEQVKENSDSFLAPPLFDEVVE